MLEVERLLGKRGADRKVRRACSGVGEGERKKTLGMTHGLLSRLPAQGGVVVCPVGRGGGQGVGGW